MQTEPLNPDKKTLRHNYIVNILDGGFFGLAMGFTSFSTVLPLFVSTLTGSALLIGLIPAIHNTGWQLPQLLTARRISHMERIKPFVMLMTLQERIPFLGIALTAVLVPHIGKQAALILTFLFLVWQGLGAGFTANAWQIMISKIIPPDMVATFLGFQSASANLLASFGAVVAGVLLENIASPWDFSTCFLNACVFLSISWFFLNQTRESHSHIERSAFSDLPLTHGVKNILQKDRPFRWFLVSRVVSQFGNMAFAFYMVYAVRHLSMTELTAGFMTGVLMVSQVAANPILGWAADRLGKRLVLALGTASTALSAILAFSASHLDLFFAVLILAGIGSASYWTVGMAYTMGFGSDEERPTYVGMANTFIAPSAIIAPLIGGWMADLLGFKSTFLFAFFSAVAATIVLLTFVRDNRQPTNHQQA